MQRRIAIVQFGADGFVLQSHTTMVDCPINSATIVPHIREAWLDGAVRVVAVGHASMPAYVWEQRP